MPVQRTFASVPTTREQQAAARREQILHTALELFAKLGYDATSTKQIARACGIAEGLIFHYFPTKGQLLTALLENKHRVMGDLQQTLAGAQNQPAREVLRRLALDWLDTLRREDAIMAVMISLAPTNAEAGKALQELIEEAGARLGLYLAARVQAGELRAGLSLKNAALTFFSPLLVFFLTYRSLPAADWHLRAAVYVEEMLGMWLVGARR